MNRLRILHQIFKRTMAYQVIGIFIAFVFIAAGIIMAAEPDITRYGDALWYCYVNLFTIGFGDIVPVTPLGRIISVILTVYASVIIALVTGIIVTFYRSLMKAKLSDTTEVLMSKVDHLPDMSKEELQELSDRIKKLWKQRKTDVDD